MDANGVFRLEATLQCGMGAIMTCRAWGLQVIVVAIRSCCKGGSAVGVCWGRDESKPLTPSSRQVKFMSISVAIITGRASV